MMQSEEPGLSLRTDNIEGVRVVRATDWLSWAAGIFFLLIGRTSDLTGIIEYAIGAALILIALAFTFVFKKVQVLKHGRWETLKSLALPQHAAQIMERLRAG